MVTACLYCLSVRIPTCTHQRFRNGPESNSAGCSRRNNDGLLFLRLDRWGAGKTIGAARFAYTFAYTIYCISIFLNPRFSPLLYPFFNPGTGRGFTQGPRFFLFLSIRLGLWRSCHLIIPLFLVLFSYYCGSWTLCKQYTCENGVGTRGI